MPRQWTSVTGVAATGRRVGRRLTARSRALPDFLVIGAQKAGTTSLGRFLRLHPDVFWVPRLEMHYFDRDYERGLTWYRSWFDRRAVIEAHERRTGRPAHVGEENPGLPCAARGTARVAADLPDVRLIVSLRDPVRRAYSQWSMNTRTGRESLPFVDALDAEPERLASVDLSSGLSGTAYLEHGYAMRSHYADHLERWLAHFDRSQIFVFRSEDLYGDPALWTSRLLDHIGVDARVVADSTLPHTSADTREPLDDTTYRHLVDRFREPDAHLADLVGMSYYQDGPKTLG